MAGRTTNFHPTNGKRGQTKNADQQIHVSYPNRRSSRKAMAAPIKQKPVTERKPLQVNIYGIAMNATCSASSRR
jgi:hypothetical protein